MPKYIRNSRRKTSQSGAAWISYSDMLAALLMMFILVLCFSIYQYFIMLNTKTAELDEKEKQLLTQEETLSSQTLALNSQQKTLEEQRLALLAQTEQLQLNQTELDNALLSLSEQSDTLIVQESIIAAAKADLAIKESELLAANATLEVKQAELLAANATLETKQQELNSATQLLANQQANMQAQQEKLDNLVGVKTTLIAELGSALKKANLAVNVDENTGDITLESAVFFSVGKNKVIQSGLDLLDAFIPVYLGVLLQPEYIDYLGEIVIEGHTDTSGAYLLNLALSQERALSVATYCLEMPGLSAEQKNILRNILTAKGRSFSDPIYLPNGEVDMDASRRVEFTFSLKDSEMIDELRDILSSETNE